MNEALEVLAGTRPWAVVAGDCLEAMPVLPDWCVDHVITDPPYEAAAHTYQRRVKRGDGDGQNSKRGRMYALHNEPLSFKPISEEQRRSAGKQFARLSRRWTVAFCQVEAAMKWSEALAPLITRRIGVWVKPDAMPQLSGDRPGMGYESIVFAHQPGRSSWNGGGRVGVFTHNKNGGGAHDHETQKPLPLMLELVSLFTDPGELVLDPFCGSGTTGVACLRLGRRFIGIERNPEWAQLSSDRLAAEGVGQTLKQMRSGQLPMFDGR